MTARRRLTDDELIDLLREAYAVMEPVPQHVLDQGYAAFQRQRRCGTFAPHEPRQAGIPVPGLPAQAPIEEDAQGWESGHRSGTPRPASADGLEGRALSSAPAERGTGGRAAAAASSHHKLPDGTAVLDDPTVLSGHQRRAPVRGRRACAEAAGAARVALARLTRWLLSHLT